jgi:hypothetical protein
VSNKYTFSRILITFTLEFNNVIGAKLGVTSYALLRCSDERISACLAYYMGAMFHRCRNNWCIRHVKEMRKTEIFSLNIRIALDKAFLQEGQIGFSSSFGLEDSDGAFEGAEDEGKVNFTGNRFFSLWDNPSSVTIHTGSEGSVLHYARGCGGFPPRHVVCSLKSL